MATSTYKYVVLGGGNASGYAAKTFVENGGKAGEMCIITEEPHVAYERPALSKGYLLGAARLPGFHTCVGGGGERQAPEWYAEKGITYLTNSKVTAASVASRTLTLANGDVVSYEKLIIATGARPVYLTEFGVPGADLGGIHYLRNVVDAEGLVAAAAAAKEAGGQAVVVGGGYIGMECAAGLASTGLAGRVTMVFPEDRLMGRLLTPQLAGTYERLYGDKGVAMVKGAKVTGFTGEGGKVTGVQYQDAQGADHVLPASLVVVGVGARANAELFAGQLDMAAGGIKVDASMETSTPGVYAVGDVAAFPLRSHATGEVQPARQEHVTHCRSSAAQAVKAAMGLAPSPYEYLPFFYSRIFNLSWVFYGEAKGTEVHFGDLAAGTKFGCLWLGHGGELLGGFLEGGSAEQQAALRGGVAAKVVLEAGAVDGAAGGADGVIAALAAKL